MNEPDGVVWDKPFDPYAPDRCEVCKGIIFQKQRVTIWEHLMVHADLRVCISEVAQRQDATEEAT